MIPRRAASVLLSAAIPLAMLMARVVALLLPKWFMTNKRFFRIWEDRGYHVTPNHYYQPIPDTRDIKESLWTKSSDLAGIDMNEQGQLDLLSQFSAAFKTEYSTLPRGRTSLPYQYYLSNGSFEAVDAEVLYCMIRHFKPGRIWEIGSGYSTFLAAQAVRENQSVSDYRCELTAFEPYPNETLLIGFPGLSRLVIKRIEDVPLAEFGQLEENDILFIDSSHVLRIGGDVQYEYLEILPRLAKGVIVHAHDIFLPAEYPKEWVMKEHRFWTEQYLLQAFLAFNRSFEVLWAGSYMHFKHREKLEAAFGSYTRNTTLPGSLWMRKVK